jgi:hypothetical protein
MLHKLLVLFLLLANHSLVAVCDEDVENVRHLALQCTKSKLHRVGRAIPERHRLVDWEE